MKLYGIGNCPLADGFVKEKDIQKVNLADVIDV